MRAVAVTGGIDHSCALSRAGGVECWGYNGHDELGTGNGDNGNSARPVGVSGLSAGVTAISAGVRHSCALTSAGGVKCWGANYGGALGDGTTSRHYEPVDVVGLSAGIEAVAAGYDASCALTNAGGVKCWGSNSLGQLGDGTTVDRLTPVDVVGLSSGVTAIAAGGVHGCALKSAGGVECWGADYGTTPVGIAGLSGVTAITAGGPICALTRAGGVKCLGGDPWTPIDVPALSTGVTAIAADAGHACALTGAGGVKCWGLNDHGQLGDGGMNDRPTPVDVSGLSRGVTAIAAGAFHSCAVLETGGVRCWGANGVGQLGDGTYHRRLTPVDVAGFATGKASLAIVSRVVTVTPARVAAVALRCGAAARCQGTLTLTASVDGKLVGSSARRVQVKLGSRTFLIGAGRTRQVKVKLAARGFRLLVRVKRLPTRVRTTYGQPAGGTTTATTAITLKAPGQTAKP
jgi:alpha-tubulin suppressor-like RCC1 family protein